MDGQASTPTGLWLASWLIANSPWLYARCASSAVRFVYQRGVDGRPPRPSVAEALLCGAAISVSALVAALVGADQTWAMVSGIAVGLAGPEVIRSAVSETARRKRRYRWDNPPPSTTLKRR